MVNALMIVVAVLAAACALNLALVLRLSHVVRTRQGQRGQVLDELSAGERMPDISLVAIDGAAVAHPELSGRTTLMGFFSPACPPCHESLPGFVASAREIAATGGGAVALIRHDGLTDPTEMVSGLDGVQIAFLSDEQTATMTAFKVDKFPTFYLFDRGTVVATGADALRQLTPA